VVHPAAGHFQGTLVNAVLGYDPDLEGVGDPVGQRPGIVHRLDKDTSGLLVVAKDDAAHRGLAAQFQDRTVERQYVAFVWGRFEEGAGRIEAPIGRHAGDRKRMAVTERGSRHAATRFEVASRFGFLTRLSVRLETGRTHQIRVHLAHAGHPVFGDPTYGGREKRLPGIAPAFREEARRLLGLISRQALHAQTLGFVHPVTGEPLRFSSDLPEDVRALEEALK
jgi:23S rRNA pseudouridine1911/1915/1917 synthase